MKRLICITVILSVVLMFAACGGNGRRASVPVQEPDAKLAAQCLENMIKAENVEDIKNYLTEDSHSGAQEMQTHYTEKNVTVEAEFKCAYKQYELFSYAVKTAGGEVWEEGAAMFLRDENGYKLCINADIQAQLRADLQCKLCGGDGMIIIGNPDTCGICGGTGMQYYPNVYYDAVLGWQGQYMACSGCAGSGFLGAGGSMTCTACDGVGLIFG